MKHQMQTLQISPARTSICYAQFAPPFTFFYEGAVMWPKAHGTRWWLAPLVLFLDSEPKWTSQ